MKKILILLILALLCIFPLTSAWTGEITKSAIDTWEYCVTDAYILNPHSLCKVGSSEYYVLADDITATGVKTIKIWDNNGTIKKGFVDSYVYDTPAGNMYAGVWHITGDIYALIYDDDNTDKVKVITLYIFDTNGTIKNGIIDTQEFAHADCHYYPDMVQVTGDYYVVLYQEQVGYDWWLETFTIDSAGAISAIIDTQEINIGGVSALAGTGIIMVDVDTVICTVPGGFADGYLYTYNISATGIITNTRAAWWEYDTLDGRTCDIFEISSNVFGIIDKDELRTYAISDAGVITKSAIDIDTHVDAIWPAYFPINGSFGITYNIGANGYVETINISDAGIIGSTRHNWTFDTVTYYTSVVHCSGNTYAGAYQGTDADGFITTFNISTSGYIGITNEFPVDGSTGVTRPPTNLSAYVDGTNMEIKFRFYNMSSKTYETIQTWTGANSKRYVIPSANLTAYGFGTDFLWGDTQYDWSINVTGGIDKSFTYNTTGNRHDVNNDSTVDSDDYDLIFANIGGTDMIYDIDGDGDIDDHDLQILYGGTTSGSTPPPEALPPDGDDGVNDSWWQTESGDMSIGPDGLKFGEIVVPWGVTLIVVFIIGIVAISEDKYKKLYVRRK